MDVVMPQLGETLEAGTVSAWRKAVGDRVTPDEPLFEVETDKVTTDVPAPAPGVLAEILVAAGETVKVGTRLAVIRTAAEEAVGPAVPAGRAPAARIERSADGGRARGVAALPPDPARRLSPVVRRLLAESHLDPAAVRGTGEGGRIRRKDVLAHLGRAVAPGKPPAPGRDAPPRAREDATLVPMGRIRKLTAAHMVRSVQTSPHVLQAVEVDFSRVDAARRERADAWRRSRGFPLTYLPFVAAAVCRAIPDFPHVNASVQGDALLVHHRVNLGVAVDLGADGLVVPVVKDADLRPLAALATAVHQLAQRARRGALSAEDVSGGTYTLSNPGPFGTLFTAPIIHQPQVAILSMDGIRKRPVALEGPGGDTVAIRPVGVLAQCFDHRAIDGAYSAAFLRRVREILEQRDWTTDLDATKEDG